METSSIPASELRVGNYVVDGDNVHEVEEINRDIMLRVHVTFYNKSIITYNANDSVTVVLTKDEF